MSFVTTVMGLMQTTAMRSNAQIASQNASQSMMALADQSANDVMNGDFSRFANASNATSPQFGNANASGNPFASLGSGDPYANGYMTNLANAEKQLMLKKIQSDVQFAAASAWYDSIAKNAEKNIKSAFSTFNTSG